MRSLGVFPKPASLAWLLLLVPLIGRGFADDDSIDPRAVEYFETHIRPVLIRECYECHSADADPVMGGLRLDTRAALLAGGDSGPTVVPGDAQRSLLIDALRQVDFEMPPEGPLDESIIRKFERWVEMGAPDPRHSQGTKNDRGPAESQAAHWAFQPIKPTPPPQVQNESWPKSPIDRFVLSRQQERGLRPVADADRRTLIRRAYFDLWGLPPEPETVDAFLNDPSPDAFAQLVDRLLDSPRFGERWGRHWLDVARYGESSGHERNFLYPHAWRFRDYVIDSFNQNKPFDQFLIEQLAGDLLPANDDSMRDQQRTATGFLALSPRNLLSRDDQFELDTADDQINVTMRAFLALTVSCARCHDHKFDPIATEEYYALAGIFASTNELYGTQPGTGGGNNRHPSDLIPLGPDGADRDHAVREHKQRIAEATKAFGAAKNRVKKLESLPKKQLEAKQDELAAAKRDYEAAERELNDLRDQAPQPPAYAMGVREGQQIVDTEVRISGDARRKGDATPRGVLNCCTAGEPPKIPATASGRLQLAEWMVSPSHPLTSRVAVNRIWSHLMGGGIVPTVDNFGVNGRPPSHPELLDHLAATFQQDGWSVKRLIRRIMLSRVYQLSSAHDPANYQIDPGNVDHWRWTAKRLEAEAIRDSILAISGQLDLCPPKTGSRVAELGDGCLVRQIDADKLIVDAKNRSIYLPAARYFEPEILQVFDGASASLVVGDRAETNVPAQSLFLLNNDFVIDQARRAAEQSLAATELTTRTRIERVFRQVLGREPSASEHRRALQYIDAAVADRGSESDQDRIDAWAGLVQSLIASAEFRYLY